MMEDHPGSHDRGDDEQSSVSMGLWTPGGLGMRYVPGAALTVGAAVPKGAWQMKTFVSISVQSHHIQHPKVTVEWNVVENHEAVS